MDRSSITVRNPVTVNCLLIQVSSQNILIMLLSAVAILIATVNIVGGFAVTQRMLKMFGE